MLTLVLLASACSTLPEPVRPPHLDHHVEAEFVVPANGRLAVPMSSPTLLLHDLALQPTPRHEHADARGRWFAYAPGTRVTLRARFRTYGSAGGPPAPAAAVLPEARTLRAVDAP